MKRIEDLTDNDYDLILAELIKEECNTLLTIPSVYEVLSEHYHNDILTIWEKS